MSYTADAFKALVATLLNRADQTTNIATWCDQAVKELEENCFWFQLNSATLSTTNAVDYTVIPVGFLREISIRDTAGVPLIKESWEQVNYWQHYTADTGEPDYYAIADKVFWYPVPNATYAMSLLYYMRVGFPTSTANVWTDTVWDLTLACTLKHAWKYLQNPNEEAKWEREQMRLTGKYKHRSGKLTGRGTVRYQEF